MERVAILAGRVGLHRKLDGAVGEPHGLDRLALLPELAVAVDLRQRQRGLRRALAGGALQQGDGFARAVFLLDQHAAVAQPFGELDLRIGIAPMRGEPPVALGDLRLRVGQALAALHDVGEVRLRGAVAGLRHAPEPEQGETEILAHRLGAVLLAAAVEGDAAVVVGHAEQELGARRTGVGGTLQPLHAAARILRQAAPVVSAPPTSTIAETKPLSADLANHS